MLNFYLFFLLFGSISSIDDEWAATNPLLHYDPFCQLQLPHRISHSDQCLLTAFSSAAFQFCGFSPPFWHFHVHSLLKISAFGQIPWAAFERKYPKCHLRQLICAELGRPCFQEKCHHNLKLNCEHWALIPRKFCEKIRQNCPAKILLNLPNAPWKCGSRSTKQFVGMEKKMRDLNLGKFLDLLFNGKCKKENSKWVDKIGKEQNSSQIDHQFAAEKSMDLLIWIALLGIFSIALNILALQLCLILRHRSGNFSMDFCWPSLLIAAQYLAIILAKFYGNLTKSHYRCSAFAILLEFASIFAQILSILQLIFWICQKLERIAKKHSKFVRNRRQSPLNCSEIQIPAPPKSPPPKTPTQQKWERKWGFAFRICFSLAFALAICAINGWHSEAIFLQQIGGCRLSCPGFTAKWLGKIFICWILFSVALAIFLGKIFGGKFSAIFVPLLFMPLFFSLKGQEMNGQMPVNLRENLLETVRCHLQLAIAPSNSSAIGQLLECPTFSNSFIFWPFIWLLIPSAFTLTISVLFLLFSPKSQRKRPFV